ncbi:hypothetical protein VTI74DRAFT_2751 [Chaetomium olivicolor]
MLSESSTANGAQVAALRSAAPSLLSKLSYAGAVYAAKGFTGTMGRLRDWKESRNPPEGRPNIVKTYECRPCLPVRIFFPSTYDQTSPTPLPTLLTIHGGGFCIGHNRDDDKWNRTFADRHRTLVISLNYRKAPGSPFPTAPHDVEALLLAALADDSLPVDRTVCHNPPHNLPRIALAGFSAGGNLALSVSQLPSIRAHPLAPSAVISVYGALDLSTPPTEKLRNRPWKPELALPRGDTKDWLMRLAPAFDWSYIPYGQDLRDPLLSPVYVEKEMLPPFVCIVAAELDMLAHESWRLACRLAGREVPDRESKDPEARVCGREAVSAGKGELVGLEREKDERFAFEERWEGGGVRWLLVRTCCMALITQG